MGQKLNLKNLDCFAFLKTTCTNAFFGLFPIYHENGRLKVRFPRTGGFSIGMAYVVSKDYRFSAKITCSGHGLPLILILIEQ